MALRLLLRRSREVEGCVFVRDRQQLCTALLVGVNFRATSEAGTGNIIFRASARLQDLALKNHVQK